MNLSESSHILRQQQSAPETPESVGSDFLQLKENEENKQEDKEKKGQTTLSSASFIFINSIIGSGIIGMPFALKEAGFGLGIICLIIVTIVTVLGSSWRRATKTFSWFVDFSLTLLIKGGELSNTNTYQDVVRAAFGRSGFILLTINQFLYPFLAMVTYNIIIGDTVTKIVIRIMGPAGRSTILARREFIIVTSALLIALPLSLYKNIMRLSKVSVLAIFAIIFIIIAMMARVSSFNIPEVPSAWQFANSGAARSIGIMAFSFMCHHNSFLLYDSLKNANAQRWGILTHVSVIFSLVCSLAVGVTGYATFTEMTEGDVLQNYCEKDDLMNVARAAFALSLLLTYPIECFVTREVIENAVFAFQQPPPLMRHVLVTITIVTLATVVSLLTDCVGIILEINGVLNAAPLAFIYPAACVLKLQNEKLLSSTNLPALLTALFGVAVLLVGGIMAVLQIIHGIECGHGTEPSYCLTTIAQNIERYNNVSHALSRLRAPPQH